VAFFKICHLANNRKITELTICDLDTSFAVISGLPALSTLSLECLDMSKVIQAMRDHPAIRQNCSSLTNLNMLHLTNCRAEDFAFLSTIALRLSTLSITRCDKFPEARHFPHVTDLTIGDTYRDQDNHLAYKFIGELKPARLNISDLMRPKDSDISISDYEDLASQLAPSAPFLTHLILGNGNGLDNFNLNDQMLGVILPLLPSLVYLDLDYCSNLTDASLNIIGKHCTALTTLSLPLANDDRIKNHNQLTETGYMLLAKGCTKLSNLDLSNRKPLTSLSLLKFAAHCRTLVITNRGLPNPTLQTMQYAISYKPRSLLSLYAQGPLLSEPFSVTFHNAVRLFRLFPIERRDSIYIKFHELAGSPPTQDPIEWGKQHCHEYILHFLDAMEFVFQSSEKAQPPEEVGSKRKRPDSPSDTQGNKQSRS